MRAIVTGCAGFIGSQLSEKLIEKGFTVVGIDSFENYYSLEIKQKNIEKLIKKDNFKLIKSNILDIDLNKIIEHTDFIFHLAAQAGVRASWENNFEIYTKNNILATQRLLESCKNKKIKKFVCASSSSIYGDVDTFPISESIKPNPISPYGVSKLAGEHLCHLYYKNFNIPTISLRYFTVYGERQRPDMAFHKFIKNIFENKEIIIFGDGRQTRDFTYVGDIIDGTISAAESKIYDEIFNLGGGSRILLKDAINILESAIGMEINIVYKDREKGDVEHTYADITKAKKLLGYNPKVKLKEGLEKEIEWIKSISEIK